ncbi:hypothetical protein Lrub_1743 [Legionella rubrilucens]|uniref:DUF2845 domain-containing protein n=1 Tax=Legionella rubrilucens TaxID=458 RepID=A0A0W0XQE7_9GAMM|nr:DUF2845 domain-containing protein [Legionella rubrilucens]KTD46821.1 hypothetical protein Lrub_1743 [Legionella rubrilucens]
MKRLMMLAGLLMALSPMAVQAMRCQQSLVYEGDTKFAVLKKCGEPLAKEIREDRQLLLDAWGNPVGESIRQIEVWTYQNSPNEFVYELTFENGRVKSIDASRH